MRTDIVCGKHSTHATQQRSGYTGDAPGGADEASVFSTVLEGDDIRNGDLHELDNAATADTLNCPRDNEPDDTLRSST